MRKQSHSLRSLADSENSTCLHEQKPSFKRRSGSAVLFALGFGIVLMILVAALFSYSSARIQNTIMESQMLKSLAVAEAGLQMAICELYQDPGFATHDLDVNQEWTNTAKAHSNYIADVGAPLNLAITQGTNGTYQGTFGEGTFKVRVGPINPTSFGDNPNTKNINEETCFMRIDSMGRVKDYVKHITAIVMRRYPGREFLMYSGDVLSLVYGLKGPGGAGGFNVFSAGHLYGHRGIEIGSILNSQHGNVSPGTRQKLNDVDLISSGMGGIFFYDPLGTPIRFTGDPAAIDIPKNVDYSVFRNPGNFAAGVNRALGSFPTSLVDSNGNLIHKPIVGYSGEKIRDKTTAMSLPPIEMNFAKFKKDAQANGKVFPADKIRKMPLSSGWPGGQEQVAILDFGNEFHEPSDTSLKTISQGSVLYSDGSIVIRGNPPVGLSIVSAKNIIVAGDFNQKSEARNEVFPQQYNDPRVDPDYRAIPAPANSAERLLDADDTTTADKRFHQPVQVVAQERVIFDYRSPVECFENELYPLLKMHIASAVADPALGLMHKRRAFDFVKLVPSNLNLQVDKVLAKAAVASMVKDLFPLNDSGLEATVADNVDTKIQSLSGNSLDAATLEDITKTVWTSYAEKYKTEFNNSAFGVYKLLDNLRSHHDTPAKIPGGDPIPYRIFFPEMTTNGMFISCAQRHSEFYSGPDVARDFDEIGNTNNEVGRRHTDSVTNPLERFIHRLYGSEVRYAYKPVHRLTGGYLPPLRKKIYDKSLPRFGILSGVSTTAGDVTQFVVISWKDLRASEAQFNAF